MHERSGTKKKNRRSFMDTIMPTYAMTSKGKSRAALPPPGGRQSDAPPLPARRAVPPPPQPNAAEEIQQEIYDDFTEDTDEFPPPPSSPPLPPPPSRSTRPLPVPQESQDLYDEFEMEHPPEINPYNPSKQEDQGEIYDEFEEVATDEVYADPDEDNDPPPPPPTNFPKTHGSKAPPLPPMGNRRGSQPLPPPPRGTKHEDTPPPQAIEDPDDIYDGPDDIDQDLYQEEDVGAPPPPPLPSMNRPKVTKPPPTPQRKEKEKKAPASSSSVPQIGLSAIQGALGKLRRISDDKTADNKDTKNEKNKDEKSKDKKLADGSRSEDSNNNNSLNAVLKPVKPKPEIPKLPNVKKEEQSSSVSSISSRFGGVKAVLSDMNSKPDIASKPKPPSKMKDKQESGVKTVTLPKLTPPTPPTPTVEVVSLIPSYDDDDDGEIYDDAQTVDLDPLSKYEWYHGKTNRADGNARLKGVGKDGTFLVRVSDKDPKQPYTMQVLFEDRVNNLKVRLRDDKRFALGESKPNEITFKDVPGIVTHHKVHPVLLIGTQQGEITLRETPKKN
ncbi:lymphocyte cytosolic protein 2-like isoform X4 [Haliotis rufescens]|uniref:lymphocyte cytosolic protein 2-like isoform X4 n=1 Tax=Haliotis rufescens TaxID=6454 RepID=UPI00201F3773|nr:lymphocyte cytosolic protein 2-like isoform X4 [Haliotis rufescens]